MQQHWRLRAAELKEHIERGDLGAEDYRLYQLMMSWQISVADMLAFIADSHWREELSYERPNLWTVTVDGQLTLVTDEDASLVRALERILGKPLERRRVEGFDVRSSTRNSHAPEERVDSRRGPTVRTGATSGRVKRLRARRQWA